MKYFSMFSGIGGFEKGIEDAFNEMEQRRCGQAEGFVEADVSLPSEQSDIRQPAYCIGFSEIDKNAINIYLKHYPGHFNYGSAFDINTAELPSFDLLVGGFPCQAFSIAGKRLGFDDTRGTLFFEIARVLREKRPGQFLLENVKGLVSHDDGKTFRTIISTLAEMGYCVEWEVLNSKNFGVPQNRERVFIHGFREGCGRQVFPLGTLNGEDIASVKEASKIIDPKYLMRDCRITEHCPTMAKRDYKEPFIVAQQTIVRGRPEMPYKPGERTLRYEEYAETCPTLTTSPGHGDQVNMVKEQIKATQGLSDAQRVREIDGEASTLKGLGGGQGAKTGLYAIPVLTPDRLEKRQNGRRFKEDGEESFTCTAQDKHGVFDGYKIRRLTPVECERLQGFQDDWTKYGADGKTMSDSARYKACGNAVTTNVIRAIMESLTNRGESWRNRD